jgi:hypothetical protein
MVVLGEPTFGLAVMTAFTATTTGLVLRTKNAVVCPAATVIGFV